MIKVIGIGDNVCDKYEHLKTMYPGGQTVNFTVYATMLGAQAAYLGVFGTDEVAEHVMWALDQHGVDRSHCRQYQGENGCARVSLVDGDRVFLGSNKGGVLKEHPIQLSQEDLDYVQGFQLIHTSNNSYLDGQLPTLRTTGVPISYDFSGQWTDQERVARVAPHVDYAFLSCGAVSREEAERICREMHARGAKHVTATRGDQGAIFFDGKELYEQPPQLVEAVDTLGAGDSFATALLLSLLESEQQHGAQLERDRDLYQMELKKALAQAAQFSAKTCLIHGAFGHGVAY